MFSTLESQFLKAKRSFRRILCRHFLCLFKMFWHFRKDLYFFVSFWSIIISQLLLKHSKLRFFGFLRGARRYYSIIDCFIMVLMRLEPYFFLMDCKKYIVFLLSSLLVCYFFFSYKKIKYLFLIKCLFLFILVFFLLSYLKYLIW